MPVSLHPCRLFAISDLRFQSEVGACGRTRTHEGQSSPPDLQSGAFAAQPHMRHEFQISNLDHEISNPTFNVLKNR